MRQAQHDKHDAQEPWSKDRPKRMRGWRASAFNDDDDNVEDDEWLDEIGEIGGDHADLMSVAGEEDPGSADEELRAPSAGATRQTRR